MKLLLDTHTFIWWDSSPSELSTKVRELCQDPGNTLVLSVVSAWEIQIKAQLGKLTLTRPLVTLVADQQATNGMVVLEITLAHVMAVGALPAVHKDPFDRLLIAQAKLEGAALLSRDPVFGQYSVQVIWGAIAAASIASGSTISTGSASSGRNKDLRRSRLRIIIERAQPWRVT